MSVKIPESNMVLGNSPDARKLTGLGLAVALSAAVVLVGPGSALAQEQAPAQELKLPDDLTLSADSNHVQGDAVIEEFRVGNRLERLTVYRENGLTEIYQNNRKDSLWFSEDQELGEQQNVRQWKLGGW